MKSIEKITLQAFFLALYQLEAHQTLPASVLAALQEISQDLSNRIWDLHLLAVNTPILAEPYRQARQWLAPQSAERSMGLDNRPAEMNADADLGIQNTDVRVQDPNDILARINSRLDDETEAARLLSQPNLIQNLRALLNLNSPQP